LEGLNKSKEKKTVHKGFINPVRQVAQGTKFCILGRKMFGS